MKTYLNKSLFSRQRLIRNVNLIANLNKRRAFNGMPPFVRPQLSCNHICTGKQRSLSRKRSTPRPSDVALMQGSPGVDGISSEGLTFVVLLESTTGKPQIVVYAWAHRYCRLVVWTGVTVRYLVGDPRRHLVPDTPTSAHFHPPLPLRSGKTSAFTPKSSSSSGNLLNFFCLLIVEKQTFSTKFWFPAEYR